MKIEHYTLYVKSSAIAALLHFLCGQRGYNQCINFSESLKVTKFPYIFKLMQCVSYHLVMNSIHDYFTINDASALADLLLWWLVHHYKIKLRVLYY